MFGFGKKKEVQKQNGIADDLLEFLNEADALYIKAFETRSIGLLKNHFTRECCYAISRWIVAEASSRYFSDEKFRNTIWAVEQDNGNSIVLTKECTFRDIRISIGRTMKVSDDYKETWTINVTPDEFWVSDVVLS